MCSSDRHVRLDLRQVLECGRPLAPCLQAHTPIRIRPGFTTVLRQLSFFLLLLRATIAADSPPAVNAPSFPATQSNLSADYPIDLPTALRLVGARSLDVQIARERLAEARADDSSATWQFFPWIAPGITYRRHDNLLQDVLGNIVDVHKESYTVGPSLISQLDLGEAIYRKLAAAQLVQAAAFALETQQLDATMAAAQTYFDLLGAQAAVQVAKLAITISTNYAAQVGQAADIGVAFKGDVLRVNVQTERYRLTEQQAQERSRVISARLAQLLRLPPETVLVPAPNDFVRIELLPGKAALAPLIAQALGSRAELKQNRATLEAARQASNGATYGPLIPTLNAQGFVGGLGGSATHVPDRFGESEDYMVSLGWRLGPGGLLDPGRRRAAQARWHIAQFTGEKLQDEITRQVVEAHTHVQSIGQQLGTAQRAAQLAEETLRLTRQRQEFAVGAVLEVLQAEQDLTRARLDAAAALTEYDKAQYALARAVGVQP